MIRLATTKDQTSILGLCQEFFENSPYHKSLVWDKEYVAHQVSSFLSDPQRLVLVLESKTHPGQIVGLLAGLVTSLPLSPTRIATEIVWYVKPEHRGRESMKLLEGYEYWAKNVMKADFISVANLSNLDLSKFYEKRGYTKTETAYMKATR